MGLTLVYMLVPSEYVVLSYTQGVILLASTATVATPACHLLVMMS